MKKVCDCGHCRVCYMTIVRGDARPQAPATPASDVIDAADPHAKAKKPRRRNGDATPSLFGDPDGGDS